MCKFGGSSVADASQIEKVRGIVAANPDRRVVVVSAPGRVYDGDEKVTDHLLNIATRGEHFRERRKDILPAESRKAVLSRFGAIAEGLGIDSAERLASLERDLDCPLAGDERIAFLSSRGEHYNAQIIADFFQASGLDARVRTPEELGLVVGGTLVDAKVLDESYDRIAALDVADSITVVPGFYGVTRDGDVAIFSRGGSDLTGGEIAYAIGAETYENWTDVSGVLEADPGIVPQARAIPRLTFKEIRLLSSKGFDVFHLDAMLRCRQRKIPIQIRNTNQPSDPGTRILNERVPEEEGVVGIARLDNVAYIYLEKHALSEEFGFTASLLSLFRDMGINTYHYPTDKDDIAVLVDQNDLKGNINDLRRAIEGQLAPDIMDVVYNMTVLTPVGLGLKHNSYPLVEALNALGEQHIPIEMIGQSPSQICFHIGVSQTVADDALRLLYQRLIAPSKP